MAVLTGSPASAFSVPVASPPVSPPETPAGVPSRLLERRPDIAAAERRVAAANAQIGVARAAYYPTLTLSASGGFRKDSLPGLLDWPSRVWSLGTSMGETVFDGGARRAAVDQSRAFYDNAVAQYRQTVLAAFQQVEDALAALRLLEEEIRQEEATVQSSARYLDLAETRYKLGIDSYLNVITAQTTLLSNRQTLVNLHTQRMLAAVQLVEALGVKLRHGVYVGCRALANRDTLRGVGRQHQLRMPLNRHDSLLDAHSARAIRAHEHLGEQR